MEKRKNYHRPSISRKYERTPKRRYTRFINYCKRLKIPVNISYSYWLSLIAKNECYYCQNTLPMTGYALDRKYPDIGYFKDNIVPCCQGCNLTKRNLYTHEEFSVMMKALKEYRERKRF